MEPVDLTSQSLGLKEISLGSLAKKTTEPSSVTNSSSPGFPKRTSEESVPLSVKRKALTSGNLSPELDVAPKTPGGGKKRKRSTEVDTPRRTAARKTVRRQKGNPEGDIPSQNSASTGSHNKEHKAPTLAIPRKIRHLEPKGRIGQNKASLSALEIALYRAKGRVSAQAQSLG